MSLMNKFPKYMPYSIKIKTSFTKTSGIIYQKWDYMSEKSVKFFFTN